MGYPTNVAIAHIFFSRIAYKTIGLYFGTNAFIAVQLARYATAQNEKAII